MERSAWRASRDERGPAIDEAGVDLHEARTRVDLGARVGAREDAAHADERHAPAQRRGELAAAPRVDGANSGRPLRPPGLARVPVARHAVARDVVLVAMMPSTPCCDRELGDRLDLRVVEVRRHLHEQRLRAAVARGERARAAP